MNFLKDKIKVFKISINSFLAIIQIYFLFRMWKIIENPVLGRLFNGLYSYNTTADYVYFMLINALIMILFNIYLQIKYNR